MSDLVITRHAVIRYRDRVRPALSLRDAHRDLDRLVDSCGRWTATAPAWHTPDDDEKHRGIVWVQLGDDIALLIQDGFALTCLIRGLLTDNERAHVTRAKRQSAGALRKRAAADPRPLAGGLGLAFTAQRCRARRTIREATP